MKFSDKLNYYLEDINCTSKQLSIKSGISESVISRYRSGQRTPTENSNQLKKICKAIEDIINEKKIKKYKNTNIYAELSNIISNKDTFNYESFSKNLNELINILKINTNEMSKYIVFDSSHISRIRYGKTRPSDPISFCNKLADFIVNKYSDTNSLKKISLLIGKAVNSDELFDQIFNYLTSNNCKANKKDYIEDFLISLNNFDLNDYIKTIKFDKLKVPSIPFYKVKTKNYYGLEEMKQAELDFFKAVILSKTKDDIFMCSDMPMEDMANDLDFGKKWMFAIAMCLKKGLHLNIIHNLDRPFNEMMLGLESWIPIYMTGQISPFYLKDTKNNIYGHLNYTSKNCVLYGECIKGHHNNGKYYLTGNKKEIKYYKDKTNFLLKKANSLMDIYNEKDKNKFQHFLYDDLKVKGNRKRILNSLPLFTINDNLLDKMLKENKIPDDEAKIIKEYKLKEEENIKTILKDNQISDIIYNYKNDFSKECGLYLSLENIFYNKKIKYTQAEYIKHLDSTINYKNKNYTITFSKSTTFKNISVTIVENNYVVISKNCNPVIHFIIRHPKLIAAIENFKPLVRENNE